MRDFLGCEFSGIPELIEALFPSTGVELLSIHGSFWWPEGYPLRINPVHLEYAVRFGPLETCLDMFIEANAFAGQVSRSLGTFQRR